MNNVIEKYNKKACIYIKFKFREKFLFSKLIFDYEIRDAKTKEVFVIGHTVQVFMDRYSHQLVLNNPDFYEEWKQKWEVNV